MIGQGRRIQSQKQNSQVPNNLRHPQPQNDPKKSTHQAARVQFTSDVFLTLVDPFGVFLRDVFAQLLYLLLELARGKVQVMSHEDGMQRFVGSPHLQKPPSQGLNV